MQQFLERAAPIVLESTVLTTERWQLLARMAQEAGLSTDEFRATLDELLQRGVLQQVDVSAAKPPALPGKRPPAVDSATPDQPLEREFALTPPPVVLRPPAAPPATPIATPATQPSVPAESGAVLSERSPPTATRARTPAAPPAGGPLESPLRPGSPAARDAGAPPAAGPRPDKSAGASGEPSGAERTGTRWRLEGEPAPIPPPPPKKPAETFRDFVRQSLAPRSGNVLSPELEQRLLQHGQRVLGLSQVYARHLLAEAIAEKKITLASDIGAAETGGGSLETTSKVDPRWQAFAAAAAPILAQHRGFTPQSRVLLNAIAREQGMNEADMEAAIIALAPAPSTALSAADARQQERLGPFREYIQTALDRAPRGILTPPLMDKLSTVGCEQYGVEREAVHNAIREQASQAKVAVVTWEQAERYVAELVAELLGEEVWLPAEKQDRLQQAAAQWGLPTARVDYLLRTQIDVNRESRRQERATTRWALAAASIAVLLVVALLGYVVVEARLRANATGQSPAAAASGDDANAGLPSVDSDLDDSWWDVHLAFAVEEARRDFPQLWGPLRDIASRDMRRRRAAYQQIADQLVRGTPEESRRQLLVELLGHCLAHDPSDECVRETADHLLRRIPDPGARLPETPDAFAAMFWCVRTVTTAVTEKSTPPERAGQLAGQLGRTFGLAWDASQSSATIEKACLSSLADRLFRMLISAVALPGLNAARLHAAVVAEAAAYLDPASLDKLNAEFLVTVLGASAESWRQYDNLLRTTVLSPEPLAILKLLELYEETDERDLQEFLAPLLLERTRTTLAEPSVEQVVEAVRRGLGVAAVSTVDDQWKRLTREAQKVLAEASAAGDQPEPWLVATARLAHYSTLACALAQNTAADSAIEALRKAGPTLPSQGDAPGSKPGDREPDPAVLAATREAALTLSRRSSLRSRVEALTSLARLAASVPDLPPDQAAGIAGYLVTGKSGPEHARVLEDVRAMARWNQLLLAVGDRLEDAALPHEQLKSLIAVLAGRDVTLAEGQPGRAEARLELWRTVLDRLEREAVPTGPPTTVGDATAAILHGLYRQQAQSLKTPLPDAAAAERTPSSVLAPLIAELSARLSSAAGSDPIKQELARTTYDVAAAEYLAADDLQRTILLERIWLRLLSREVVRRDDRRAAEANKIVDDLRDQDHRARTAVNQLRDGQAAILRMWLLLGKRS